MPRSNAGQSKHNNRVKKLANELQKQGYDVSADLPKFSKPETIGGYRPDIIARKNSKKMIVEVETQDSVNNTRDKNQQKAFGNAAKRNANTTFKRDVV